MKTFEEVKKLALPLQFEHVSEKDYRILLDDGKTAMWWKVWAECGDGIPDELAEIVKAFGDTAKDIGVIEFSQFWREYHTLDLSNEQSLKKLGIDLDAIVPVNALASGTLKPLTIDK